MLLSLERLRLEVRRSRTLVKTTLMFLGFFGIFVVIVFTVIFYAQKVTSRAGDIDVLRWVFFGSSAVTLLFSIACFLTFRFYLSAQAESAWLRSHEAAFSLRMLAL
ncbi:MAG: hypothetical protein IOD12_08535 [Silvanigrellales bacterium]|nr:hypothetical protein [Silvanigrellales bacterium]